jgi:putative aldouronate transport system substrate-binding protein
MISANCKNPEAAFRVGDIMMREDISITNRFGERGVQWDFPADIPNAVEKFDLVPFLPGWSGKAIIYDDSSFWSGSSVQNAAWRQLGAGCIPYSVLHGRLIPRNTMVGRQEINSVAMAMYTKQAFGPKEILGKLIYAEDEMAVVREVQATLNSYVLEMTSNFLAGNRDIDASWNSYIAELNTIGLPRLLGIVQKVYDRMYKK